MKIAIHFEEKTYSEAWITYCKNNGIDYKVVNAFDSDIISQLSDCDIFMWHFSQVDAKAMNVAKQILFALQQSGKIVFPDFYTGWHFDDKLGQKYLFEAMNVKAAKSYSFFTKRDAIEWAKGTEYPKVFKLRGGSGSYNVSLVLSYKDARRKIIKAFGKGYKSFERLERLKRNFVGLFKGHNNLKVFLGAVYRCFVPNYTKKLPIQREYALFQEFIPNKGYDYRVEVCGDKCIALIRYCRKNDFRASGGHNDHFEKELIEKDVIKFAFEVVDKMHLQSAALDIIRHKDTGELYLIENSYCYGVDKDEYEHGYWDKEAKWHNEQFDGRFWMVERAIEQYEKSRTLSEV